MAAADGLLLCRDCREVRDAVWLDSYLGRKGFRETTDEEIERLEREVAS